MGGAGEGVLVPDQATGALHDDQLAKVTLEELGGVGMAEEDWVV